MPGQIFDDGGQQYSMSDGSGLSSSIVDLPPTPSPRMVGPQVVSALGQDAAPAMWPGSIIWGMGMKVFRIQQKRFNFTRTSWYKDNLSQDDIFANHVSSMGMKVFRIRFVALSYTRMWNGIGGTIYLPSFPQLDRQETVWPHAT